MEVESSTKKLFLEIYVSLCLRSIECMYCLLKIFADPGLKIGRSPQPGMKPGERKNQRRTIKVKMTVTAISSNLHVLYYVTRSQAKL